MGFHAVGIKNAAPPPVELLALDEGPGGERYRFDRFQLRTPFAFTPSRDRWTTHARPTYAVPAHPNPVATSTDLASIPAPLRGLLSPYGRHLRAALLHDHLCDQVNLAIGATTSVARLPRARKRELARERQIADDLFFHALRHPFADPGRRPDARSPVFRASLFWTGVTLGRLAKLQRLRFVALGLHVLAWYVVVVKAIEGGSLSGRWSIAAVVLTGLIAAWGRLALAVVTSIATGPFVAIALAGTGVATTFVGLVDGVVKLGSTVRSRFDPGHVVEPSPVFSPTVTPR